MIKSATMIKSKPIFKLAVAGAICQLLASCATLNFDTDQEGWKQFAAAADANSNRPGTVNLQFAWETPKKRLLLLASQGAEQIVLYQVDPGAGTHAGANGKRVNCYFKDNQLYCAGPGEAAPSPVAGSGADLWQAIATDAASRIAKSNALSQAAMRNQLASQQPGPQLNLARQRHPFEWGGEYETVENAQAFLEAVTAQGTPFRSTWPQAPSLGSTGNNWKNEGDRVSFKTAKRCSTLASSAMRTVIHYNHDFWASDTLAFETVYRWQQPIDWRRVNVKIDQDGVFMHGTYGGAFQDQGLAYISGWSPDILTANATRFDPAKYSVAEWNIHLVLPDSAGMRERVLYAATYLNIMCGKG